MSNRKNLISFFSEYKEIRIPRIQRAYAQGRKNEFFIRNSFLEDLFNSLIENDILELNYVYGIENKGGSFELLDGQQRITTLFLLHWYIACREGKLDDELKSTLSKFRYETRHTSSDFCEALSRYQYVPVEEEKPSKTIRKQFKWYFKSFDLDSTIDSMLRMLDAIDEQYNSKNTENIFEALNNIQFYVLNLEEYNLTEELYIKMNARGLPLTPFENFKADFINYLKNTDLFNETVDYEGHRMPAYLKIASELDGKWVDVFWDDDDYKNIDKTEYDETNEDYSVKYFRFFYRYFASTYILKYRTDIKSEPMRQDKGYLFFHQLSEQQKLNNYYRFKNYYEMVKDHPEYVVALEKVLNTLYVHYYSGIKPLLTPSWGDSDNWDFFSAIKPNGFTLQRRIVFAAICEFIEAYDFFDIDTFRKWMRVVWNVVNNTDIDSISPATYLERSLSNIIRDAAESEEEFYHFLSHFNSRGDDDDKGGERSKSISEEIIKARYIVKDERWLPLFEKAEANTFCKGMVRFFLRDEGDTPEMFARRFAYVEQLFSAEGVTAPFSQDGDYILLRAMISCINNWNCINYRYLTDKVERKYNALKVMLTTPANYPIRDFLCTALEADNMEKVVECLNEVTGQPSRLDLQNYDDKMKSRITIIHERLFSNSKYIRWMQEHKALRVFPRYNYYYGLEYGSSYNIVLLESDRDLYVKKLIEEEGFELYNNQKSSLGLLKTEEYNEYGVLFGYHVHLKKEIKGWNVRIVFSPDCKMNVSIECSELDKHQLTGFFDDELLDKVVEESDPVRRYIKINVEYHTPDSYPIIHEQLFGIEGVFTILPEYLPKTETAEITVLQ